MKLLNLSADKSQENTIISAGRSMVEMLGVLAIIGVLSVGGIAGYNTAMYKYRMNKTVQAFSDLLQNLVELSAKDWGGVDIGWQSAQLVKYGLLPASMCPEDYVSVSGDRGRSCKLPLGEIDMIFEKNPFLGGEFFIIFFEGDIVKSCVDFLSHGWQNMYPQEWLRIDADENITGSFISVRGDNLQYLWAVKGNIYGEDAPTSITLSDIQNACDLCKGATDCRIELVINNEF